MCVLGGIPFGILLLKKKKPNWKGKEEDCVVCRSVFFAVTMCSFLKDLLGLESKCSDRIGPLAVLFRSSEV